MSNLQNICGTVVTRTQLSVPFEWGSTSDIQSCFTDQSTLFGALSPKRMELLRYLRQAGPMSARQIAKNLGRDYKNIQVDIKLFSRLELILTNEEGRYIVPWDDISIEVTLAA